MVFGRRQKKGVFHLPLDKHKGLTSIKKQRWSLSSNFMVKRGEETNPHPRKVTEGLGVKEETRGGVGGKYNDKGGMKR